MSDIKIPRIFHRIWVGEKSMPEEYIQYQKTWAKHHPEWEFKLWTDENMIPLKNQREYDNTTSPALKADIARLEILYKYGGVYIDCDFECLKNIEPLLDNVEAFAAWQDDYLIATGIMGCVPEHYKFKTLVFCLTANINMNRKKLLPHQAGPVYITKILKESRGVTIFPKEIFYPYYYTEKHRKYEVFSNSYAVHHWSSSWLPEAEDEDKSIEMPKVSVLMSVYNAEKYLKTAIESILNQSYKNFNFIIVDDGSTDSSKDIINSYNDYRIKVIINEKNRGLVYSLNKGLDECDGKYVVRMDSDDYSLPNRLETQVKFMEAHEEVGVCGSWYSVLNKDFSKKMYTVELPTTSEEISSALFFGCSLCHPSTIFRLSYFNDFNLRYREIDKHAEDYGLWVRCDRLFKLSNIPEVLIYYRSTPTGICHKYPVEQKESTCRILQENLKNIGFTNVNEDQLKLHYNIAYSSSRITSYQDKKKLRDWYNTLIKANIETEYYPEPYFKEMLQNKIFQICDAF